MAMKAITKGHGCLGTYDGPRVEFECKLCGRQGNYATHRLIAEFGPDLTFPEFRIVFAASRGCERAKNEPGPYEPFQDDRCQIKYVVE